MKVKFKVGVGHRMVQEYTSNNGIVEDVIRLSNDHNVLSLSFVRQTPKQYLTEALNDEKCDGQK